MPTVSPSHGGRNVRSHGPLAAITLVIMPWTCERCHHFNLAIPGDESTSLLDDSRQVFT
jgi:hypothetical protein